MWHQVQQNCLRTVGVEMLIKVLAHLHEPVS